MINVMPGVIDSAFFFFGHLYQILKLRLREAEQQRLRAEVERQRQIEGRERLRNLNTIQEEILQLNQLLDPSTQSKLDVTPAGFSSFSARGNQLCSQVSEVVRKTTEVSLSCHLQDQHLFFPPGLNTSTLCCRRLLTLFRESSPASKT